MRTPAIVLMCSFAVALAAPLQAQTLLEVAKKEADRRKGAKPAGKVYTNDDLKPVPQPPPGSTPVSTPPVASAPAADTADKTVADASAGQTKTEVKDRAWWASRIAAAREDLEHNRVLAEALQSRINALTADFSGRDDPAQRAKIGNDRDKALAELERLKRAVAAAEKAIPAIEEEARRAGVPPGWLR